VRTNRNRIVVEHDIVRRYPIQDWDRQRLQQTAAWQELARTSGLPVPAVLAVHDGGPHPHLVMQRAHGTPLMETPLSEGAQLRLGREVARVAAMMRNVHDLPDDHPTWTILWEVLARIAPVQECQAAAEVARTAPTCLVHGDLSAGNLIVTPDGDLVAILDWDGASRSDPAMDWAALCANCPPGVVAAMRAATPEATALDARAQVYLGTWPVQHDLWLAGDHPWLSGDRPLTEPRT